MSIIIKTSEEVATMKQAGRIVAAILRIMTEKLKPGMKTKELDAIADKELKRYGATSSFKEYHGFPANLCVSVNNEIVHGIPGERVLHEGDIVSLDFGAIFNGFQADAAVTTGVGKVNAKAKRLMEATEGALEAGIRAARPGARLGDISAAIQDYAEGKNGFRVVREYTGHGIGRDLHEDPQIPNFRIRDEGLILQKGMTLAIEPMVNAGDWQTQVDGNHWTVTTTDKKLSAHFEHTIAITDGEAEVLTK